MGLKTVTVTETVVGDRLVGLGRGEIIAGSDTGELVIVGLGAGNNVAVAEGGTPADEDESPGAGERNVITPAIRKKTPTAIKTVGSQ